MDQELARSCQQASRGTRRRWPAYLLLILGCAAILAGVGWQAIQARLATPVTGGDRSLGLPRWLSGVPATQPEFGGDALRTIESMHGKGFGMVNGAVMHYGSATVWVAQAQDEAAAKAMTNAMAGKIAGGRSPFAPTGTRQTSGRAVHTLNGLGQSHFFWQSGDKVVWLSIDPSQSEASLQELVQAVN